MTVDPHFEEYVKVFESRVIRKRHGEMEGIDDVQPIRPREPAVTEVFLETLEDTGQLPGLEIASFEKRLGRASAKVNAYGFADADARLDLVVTIARDGNRLETIPAGEVDASVRKALHAFRGASERVFEKMEPSSPACDMMEFLHSLHGTVRAIRVTVLVDGLAKGAASVEQLGDFPEVTADVWDLERLFRASASGLSYESFVIDVLEHLGQPLPCLEAERTAEDHRCYLAIIPGELLYDLYNRHGARLLELNVRSFLQARGKVNRGIRDTLLKDPGHFLAFNNGISATVEALDLTDCRDGAKAIQKMQGLQVVNGGQTVASIHRAKARDRVDLSKVFVQAKITVVEPQHLETLVPSISRFANTQNKVNETDFSANHPFHVRIQQLSERIWVPGETSRWFYERARGQWEVARAREGTTPARVRAFDERTPRTQRIDKTLLARAANAWEELPHVVSLGGQKNFVRFMERLASLGEGFEADETYFRRMVAKVIILKRAEKIGRQIAFTAYRANAVCYAVSLLAYRTSGRVDLDSIWENQDVSEAMHATLHSWMPAVHEELVESAGGRNVTEWCKRKECWTHVQSLELELARGLEKELGEGNALPNVGEFAAGNRGRGQLLSAEERERQMRTMSYDAGGWLRIMKWAREHGELNGFQFRVATTIAGYAAGGWAQIPSPKQTKHAVEIIDRWERLCGEDEEEAISALE